MAPVRLLVGLLKEPPAVAQPVGPVGGVPGQPSVQQPLAVVGQPMEHPVRQQPSKQARCLERKRDKAVVAPMMVPMAVLVRAPLEPPAGPHRNRTREQAAQEEPGPELPPEWGLGRMQCLQCLRGRLRLRRHYL